MANVITLEDVDPVAEAVEGATVEAVEGATEEIVEGAVDATFGELLVDKIFNAGLGAMGAFPGLAAE